jgi:protein MpaA
MVERSILMGAVLFMCGCASQPDPKPIMPPRYPPGGGAMISATPQAAGATIIGYSVQRRPIELYSFGSGERPVLVMGAIHGSEPTSADVSRGLLAELHANPQLCGGVPVVIIPVANPDGLAAATRTNSRGVDLNRNFPATNWSTRSRRPRNYGGQQSASEPETNALIETIQALKPRLIISVHSMENPTNNYDGPAQPIAELMSRYNHYPPTATIGYPTPGSLGSWAGIDQQIPMITLELPRSLPASQAWPNNRQAVLTAIAATATSP